MFASYFSDLNEVLNLLNKSIDKIMLVISIIIFMFIINISTIINIFALIGVAICIALFLFRNNNKFVCFFWRLYLALMGAFSIMLATFIGLILSEINSRVDEYFQVDYAIVLGAGLNGDKISERLKIRLDTAYNQLRKIDIPIIVSGGQGQDELISEAEAMSNYLIKKGISEDRIILEERSTSTNENIRFSNNLINKLSNKISVVIFTSDYHMYRAKMLGSRFGWEVKGYSAKNPLSLRIKYLPRECLALFKDFIIN